MIKTGMVVGTSTPRTWSQVAIKPTNVGKLIVVVRLNYQGEGDLVSLSQIGTGLLESLKENLAHVRGSKKLYEETLQILSGVGDEVNLSVGLMAFEGDQLYMAGVGEIEVYIARDGRVGRIFAGNSQIEGQTLPGDLYALTSVETPSSMGIARWKEILLKGTAGLEELAVNVHGKREESGGMVTAFAQLISETKVEQPKFRLNLANAKQLFSSIWERPLTIKREQLKVNAWVGVVLAAVLLFGVVLGVMKRSHMVKESVFNNVKLQVDQRVAEARSISDLNPERAKYLINSATDEINTYMASNPDDNYTKRANEIATQIREAETEIFKKEEVETNIFVETEVIQQNYDPMKMINDDEGNIILANTSGGTIWGISLVDKSSWKVELSTISLIKDISIYKDQLFILGGDGVYTTDKNKNTTKKIIEPDDLWGEASFVDNYAGNAYVLDKGQGEIWKYPALLDGYGARRRWLGAGISLDLSNVTDVAVDGDIWLITSSGKLEQYRRGVPIEFAMEGFPYAEQSRLSGPTAVFLSEDKVYVVEAGAKRVVVLDKESGRYENQYVNDEFAKARAMVVHEGKCYILVDKKIIWFEL